LPPKVGPGTVTRKRVVVSVDLQAGRHINCRSKQCGEAFSTFMPAQSSCLASIDETPGKWCFATFRIEIDGRDDPPIISCLHSMEDWRTGNSTLTALGENGGPKMQRRILVPGSNIRRYFITRL
jgi:hypothetical protein